MSIQDNVRLDEQLNEAVNTHDVERLVTVVYTKDTSRLRLRPISFSRLALVANRLDCLLCKCEYNLLIV
jgi:hypothetical protein